MSDNLPHYILIRSAYTDTELSRQRLDMTRLTIAPSLKHQRTPFTAVVQLSPNDPHRAERVRLFERACQSVAFIDGPRWGQSIDATGPRLVTRVDDDDIIASWFTERIQQRAATSSVVGDAIFYWPNGYVLADRPRWWSSETNQFQTLLTSSPDSGETPFREHHAHVRDRWPVVEVDAARAWCWVQHPQARTWRTDRRWSGRIEDRPMRHFTADLSAVSRHLAGQHLTAYQQALNDWSLNVGRPSMTITPKLWQTIRKIVKPGMRTLECGSGLSTILFDRLTDNHTALEHDPDWFRIMQPISASVRLCEIDESTGWYGGWEPVEPVDVVLVDGPTGAIGRSGILHRLLGISTNETTFIVDDTHRPAESALSAEIARRLNKPVSRFDDSGKQFSIVGVPLPDCYPFG